MGRLGTPQQNLVHLAEHWLAILALLARVGSAALPGLWARPVVSPYKPAAWKPEHSAVHGASSQFGYTVATFGWWELRPPTRTNLAELIAALRQRSIGLCAVTGLPMYGLYKGLLEREGYGWVGPRTSHVAVAGFLVREALLNAVSIQPANEVLGTRHVAIILHGRAFQAAYIPCVGKFPAAQHRAMLAASLLVHRQLQQQVGESCAWTMGDFNLRGLAGGAGVTRGQGSQAQQAATWFARALSEHNLRALPSAPTHVRGGTLDMHITTASHKQGVLVHDLGRRLSDHFLVVAEAQFQAPGAASRRPPTARRQAGRVSWERSQQGWLEACKAERPLVDLLRTAIHEAAAAVVQEGGEALQGCLVDVAALLIHSLIVQIGHQACLVKIHGRSRGGEARNLARDLHSEQEARHASLAAHAEEHPQDVQAQLDAVEAWAWLQQLRQELRRGVPSNLAAASFVKAARGGQAALDRWFTSETKVENPPLVVSTDQQAASLLSFRSQVALLDNRCSFGHDHAAISYADVVRRQCRDTLKRAQAPPDPVAPPQDTGQAWLFFSPATVARVMRKRKQAKSSACLPNGALAGLADFGPAVWLLMALADLVWAEADVGSILPVITISHLHKGKAKDPRLNSSFRPVGAADPVMSIIADLFHMRTAHLFAWFAGPTQLGGTADPRFLAALMLDGRVVRRAMGLPTCDLSADARFGFDGGRHGQLLRQAHRAGATPRDWLVVDSLLRRASMLILANAPGQPPAALPPLKPQGGGMVQGLAPSTSLYGLLPRELADEVLSALPPTAVLLRPQLVQAFHSVADGDLALSRGLDLSEVRVLAWRLELVIQLADRQGWTGHLWQQAVDIFRSASSDAVRLCILDWSAELAVAVGLFVDDARIRTSSPAALAVATRAASAYACRMGVIFETGDASKTTACADLQGFSAPDLLASLEGALQGGTPMLVTETKFLGVQEALQGAPSAIVLRQVERKGDLAARTSILAAEARAWPLAARRLYMNRVTSTVLSLLPLTVAEPTAALRLGALQGRWGLAVLVGGHATLVPRLSRDEAKGLVEDLGWQPLWDLALVEAIMLLQKMALGDQLAPHSRWANVEQPHPATWVAHVKGVMSRFAVPDIQLPTEDKAPRTCSSTKLLFIRYRRQVVEPAVASGLGHLQQPRGLPWPWITVAIQGRERTRHTQWWWHWRIRGVPLHNLGGTCPACGAEGVATSQHLTLHCQAMASWAAEVSLDGLLLFARPKAPVDFLARLDLVGRLLAARLLAAGRSGEDGELCAAPEVPAGDQPAWHEPTAPAVPAFGR